MKKLLILLMFPLIVMGQNGQTFSPFSHWESNNTTPAVDYPSWYTPGEKNNILIVGTSFTMGSSATNTETGGFAYLIEDSLKALYGDGGSGLWNVNISPLQGNAALHQWHFTGNTSGNCERSFFYTSVGLYSDGVAIDTITGDSLELYYYVDDAFGKAASWVIVDETDSINLPAIAATGTTLMKTVGMSLGTYGDHRVRIRTVGGASYTFFSGAMGIKGVDGINVVRIGNAGATSKNYNVTYGNAASQFVTMDSIKPKLSIIELGVNDYVNQATIDTQAYKNNIAAIAARLIPHGKVIAVNSIHFYEAGGPLPIETYNLALQHVCDSLGVTLIDMHTEFGGTLAAGVAAGYQTNGDNHPTDLGHRKFADVLLTEILK